MLHNALQICIMVEEKSSRKQSNVTENAQKTVKRDGK